MEVAKHKNTDSQQSESLFDFIQNASLPMHWVNGSGIIVWANQAELDFLGYKKEEYIGKHISKFHADRELIENMLHKLTNKESLHNCPAKMVCKSGEVKDVLVNSNVYWEDGHFVNSRCFTTDVTAITRDNREKTERISILEERLRTSEEQYNKMISEVEDYAIILLDLDGTVLNWNKGAERIKGYKENEIVGQNFRVFYLPQDRQNGLPERLIRDALKYGRAFHEGLRMRKNGTNFWGTIVITALHNDKGEVIGFTKMTHDLTDKEKMRMEQERNM
jgi:PAS domain S-box-containing protein